MGSMFKGWIIEMALRFIMRQLDKWQMDVDWAKVKADVAERLAGFIPGYFFDAYAIAAANSAIDAVAAALASSEDLAAMVKLLVDGEFQKAWEMLRALIMGKWSPVSDADQAVMACVSGCEAIG
jgi:hypothetical protein